MGEGEGIEAAIVTEAGINLWVQGGEPHEEYVCIYLKKNLIFFAHFFLSKFSNNDISL